ncbi:MAG: CCA tRNA nucleotidyltransferase [Candidatus Dadabacteria bacterium]|nr:MAG: CCA tRNA nucleotidyltransferase [Candidatus Dadabacteria bacterium]
MTEVRTLLKHARDLRDDAVLAPLFDALADAPGRLGFVGGIVRDWLLDRWFDKDIDLVWDGPFEALSAALHKADLRGRLRPDYLTATVNAGELRVDVAATRRDTYPTPGGVPRIEPASLDDDLRRRDFTANAIAVFPDTEEVVDPCNGLTDIRARRLVPIRENTLLEDPVRLLRGVRYLSRFGWQPGGDWEPGLNAARSVDTWRVVARGRIWREVEHVADEPDAPAAWTWLRQFSFDTALLGIAMDPPIIDVLAAWRMRFAPLPRVGTGRRWLLDLHTLETAAPGVAAWIRDNWDTPAEQLRRYEKLARRIAQGLAPFRS